MRGPGRLPSETPSLSGRARNTRARAPASLLSSSGQARELSARHKHSHTNHHTPFHPTQDDSSSSPTPECATCGGSGRVPCPCTRWSDGDAAGCATCGGSRAAACHHCGGGGRAVPLARRVHVERTPSPYEKR